MVRTSGIVTKRTWNEYGGSSEDKKRLAWMMTRGDDENESVRGLHDGELCV